MISNVIKVETCQWVPCPQHPIAPHHTAWLQGLGSAAQTGLELEEL